MNRLISQNKETNKKFMNLYFVYQISLSIKPGLLTLIHLQNKSLEEATREDKIKG